MAGAYRSWHDLMKLRTAEYRFYENSLRNFVTIHQYMDGGGLSSDLGEYNGAAIMEGWLDNFTGGNWYTPRQSHELGLPCIMLDKEDQAFRLPVPLLIADEAAFTLEYVGVPRRSMNQGDDLLAPNRITLISDSAGPCYVTLLSDHAAGANNVEMCFGGVARVSDDGTWWRSDHPLHLVVSRPAGHDVDTDIWCNGAPVNFSRQGFDAGDLGFTFATGRLFNRSGIQIDNEPFCGGHFLLRRYNDNMLGNEVNRLWQRARKLFPNLMFPIPVVSDAPA